MFTVTSTASGGRGSLVWLADPKQPVPTSPTASVPSVARIACLPLPRPISAQNLADWATRTPQLGPTSRDSHAWMLPDGFADASSSVGQIGPGYSPSLLLGPLAL